MIIRLDSVTDRLQLFGEQVELFSNVNFHLPPGRYALLSESPEYHRAVIDILSGVRPPLAGRVDILAPMSWPIGRTAMVRGRATGAAVMDLIAGLYGLDSGETAEVINLLLSRPDYLDKPMSAWPPYLRREFIFTLGLVPEFDVYVIDGMIPFEESRFTRLWQALFEERLVGKSLILASPRQKQLLDYCSKAIVYADGALQIKSDLENVIERYPVRPERADLGQMFSVEDINDQGLYY